MSWNGSVTGLFTSPKSGEPMVSLQEVEVVAGVGISNDRYAIGEGKFSAAKHAGQALTLFEQEAVEAVKRDYKIDLDPSQTRRNVMTRGVPLNHLVGKQFNVGEVVVRGVKLNEPCSHLEKLTGISTLRKVLRHRGGLRVDVISGGRVHVGDLITP